MIQLLIFIHFSQEMASGIKSEIAKRLLDLNVSTFSMAPVKVCGSPCLFSL